jgi:hypothetical protein
MFLFVSSLIRLRMATADCFVEYVVFIYYGTMVPY